MRLFKSVGFLAFVLGILSTVLACHNKGENTIPPPPPNGVYHISGEVRLVNAAGQDLGPVPNVVVKVNGTASGVVTERDGHYSVTALNGRYTVTVELAGHSFDPPEGWDLEVRDGDASGFNFTETASPIADGKFVYPCTSSVCVKDYATGGERVAWTSTSGAQPRVMVPLRDIGQGPLVSFAGDGFFGIELMSLASSNPPITILPGNFNLAPDCTSRVIDRQYEVASLPGDPSRYMVIPAMCSDPSGAQWTDIWVIRTSASGTSGVRITNDRDLKLSPNVGQINSGGVFPLFYHVPSKGQVVKLEVDTSGATPSIVGSPVVYANDVASGSRAMVANGDYSKYALMLEYGSESYIVIRDAVTGEERVIGQGSNPYLALDRNRVMYTRNGLLLSANLDGTDVRWAEPPSNLLNGALPAVVFAPAGS